ncbi:MAG TPA: hypothetical protein VM165_18740, partial [Planctomycetaceae bacterium]|nr:hypothetical protein [Planctomycetaceae bacterium]
MTPPHAPLRGLRVAAKRFCLVALTLLFLFRAGFAQLAPAQEETVPKSKRKVVRRVPMDPQVPVPVPKAVPMLERLAPAAVQLRGEVVLQPGVRPGAIPTQPLVTTATLNTNEELERLLDRADQLVASGRSDLVPVLWQRVLDEAGDVLASQGDGKEETRLHVYQRYRPLREEVIRRMVASGPDALKAYRLQMDGVARSKLGDETVSREAALSDVVQRLLLTTSGPAAAFESACLRLEKGDYLSAVRLLTAVEQCPEHGLASAAVTARLSVALARLGALSAARERLARDETVSAELRTLLETDFARFAPTKSHNPVVAASSDSLLPDRDAVLQEGWQQRLAYTLKAPAPQPAATGRNRTVIANMNGRQVVLQMDANGRLMQPNANDANARDLKPGELVSLWTDAKWQPVGRAQVVGDRVLVKSQERLLCLDLETGRTLWMG